MSQKAIITDLNKCLGCLACVVGCKTVNEVPIGKFWNNVLRIGPNPKYEGAVVPDVEMYSLPTGCQPCAIPSCVKVCPTGASTKNEQGVVVIDTTLCIGCQACIPACPYGARYLNEELGIVQKCTMCLDRTEQGELPQCVSQCCGRARFYGDLDEGYESFVGPGRVLNYDATYDDVHNARCEMLKTTRPFTDDEVYHLKDSGTGPSFAYILRGKTWHDEAVGRDLYLSDCRLR